MRLRRKALRFAIVCLAVRGASLLPLDALAQSGSEGGSIGGAVPPVPTRPVLHPPAEKRPDRARFRSQGRIDVPVLAGGNPDFQACPTVGEIVGLDPNGDGFLSVRSGPGGRPFQEIDRVYNGMRVKICDQHGPWYGVVYDADNRTDRCNVDASRSIRGPYTGPCRYGWIHSRYVGDIAG